LELEIQRHERINAPLQLVWEEMDSLEQILAKSRQISDYAVAPGGQKATGNIKLAWGPVKWTIGLEVLLTRRIPRQHVTFAIGAPSLETQGEITTTLAPIGEIETKLDYRCALEVRHRMASRMRGLFNEILEDQAHSILHRVKVKSEQRRLAQEKLLT
jgi:carbon monoxide dehydrogenase subunit G